MPDVTITVNAEELEKLIKAAAEAEARRIAREQLQGWSVRGIFQTACRQAVREMAGDILREAVRAELKVWLDAREGWIAKVIRRARFTTPDTEFPNQLRNES